MDVSGQVAAILAQRKGQTVWYIAPEATVFEAIELMAQKNVGALPVVDNGRLAGIISEGDFEREILQGNSRKRNHDRTGPHRPTQHQRYGVHANRDRTACASFTGYGWKQAGWDCFDWRFAELDDLSAGTRNRKP